MTRIYRVESRKELDKKIDEYITRGYTVKYRGERTAHLKKKNWGSGENHAIIALLTVWWTVGMANALYAIYKRVTAEEVEFKVDKTVSN